MRHRRERRRRPTRPVPSAHTAMVDLVLKLDWSNVETGVWCPRCLLPSGLTVPYTIGGRGPHVVRFCDDCGDPIAPDSPAA